MRLGGKRALVTGGARGIGKGIVGRFLAEGANVIALDRNEAELEALREEFAGQAESLALSVCDLRDLGQLEQAAGEAFDRWQGIDIVINNAGIAYREPFLDIPLAHWDAVMDINVRAVFRLGQLAAERMIRQGTGGSIVNMSSKNGLAGSSMLAHYNASKAGVILLSQSMAVELAPYGIRVNVVAPGFVETLLDRELRIREGLPAYSARTPMQRSATIDEVVNVFLFLASDESSYVTGSTITVDGGHLANASEF